MYTCMQDDILMLDSYQQPSGCVFFGYFLNCFRKCFLSALRLEKSSESSKWKANAVIEQNKNRTRDKKRNATQEQKPNAASYESLGLMTHHLSSEYNFNILLTAHHTVLLNVLSTCNISNSSITLKSCDLTMSH